LDLFKTLLFVKHLNHSTHRLSTSHRLRVPKSPFNFHRTPCSNSFSSQPNGGDFSLPATAIVSSLSKSPLPGPSFEVQYFPMMKNYHFSAVTVLTKFIHLKSYIDPVQMEDLELSIAVRRSKQPKTSPLKFGKVKKLFINFMKVDVGHKITLLKFIQRKNPF
jgi:hypothetical protein